MENQNGWNSTKPTKASRGRLGRTATLLSPLASGGKTGRRPKLRKQHRCCRPGRRATTPFGGGHAKAFLELAIEYAEVPIAAVHRHLHDAAVGFHQQPARLDQPQFGLAHPQRHAELIAKKTIEMPHT